MGGFHKLSVSRFGWCTHIVVASLLDAASKNRMGKV